MTHDQRFKNPSLDYPRQALSLFAAAEVVGLEDEDRETALAQASPFAPAPTTAPAADVIALDSLLDALDAGAPTTGVIVTLHPTAEALALAARAASALQAAAWATTSTECARHGPRLATRKEVAGESRRLMPV